LHVNPYAVAFYFLAAFTVGATALAVTARNAVHAAVYLMISFLGTALLYYLLGAPLLAALQVILYAGAVVVFILFMVMTMAGGREAGEQRGRWLPAVLIGCLFLGLAALFLWAPAASRTELTAATSTPRELGAFVLREHWLALEIASFLLFAGLVGALYLGRPEDRRRKEGEP
jgi:NADH-quinone oxidoreductase subunit J